MLLELKNIKKYFKQKGQIVKAIDDVDLFVEHQSTTALVGESGCGKTTLAKTILGFYNQDSGTLCFQNKDISNLRANRKVISKNIQIVFQNPYLSFDPRFTIFSTLFEALVQFNPMRKEKAMPIISEKLNDVGLNEDYFFQYPHQLSGGELQRVSIARALMANPKLVVLDEPTSSLDVTTTIKIVSLLDRLKREFSLSYLFISHNLKLVKKIADFIFVMYDGQIVEYGPKTEVYGNPLHPYTKLLLDASNYKIQNIANISENKHKGCIFSDRCPRRFERCSQNPLKRQVKTGHFAFCHLYPSQT